MDSSGTKELADIAYALFEHFLTGRLHEKKTPLFKLVEENIQFKDEFSQIFTRFSEQFPDVATCLNEQFDSPDEMYRLITEGEGVIPTRTFQTRWIIQDAPETDPHATEDERAGKWMIFSPPEEVDRIWSIIRNYTWEGKLGISSRASTAKRDPDSRDNRWVIFVYTSDWEDQAEVMRVREALRQIGIEDRIGYKRNLETFAGEYSAKGKKVTYYTA